jgi:hypothetical protein
MLRDIEHGSAFPREGILMADAFWVAYQTYQQTYQWMPTTLFV